MSAIDMSGFDDEPVEPFNLQKKLRELLICGWPGETPEEIEEYVLCCRSGAP